MRLTDDQHEGRDAEREDLAVIADVSRIIAGSQCRDGSLMDRQGHGEV